MPISRLYTTFPRRQASQRSETWKNSPRSDTLGASTPASHPGTFNITHRRILFRETSPMQIHRDARGVVGSGMPALHTPLHEPNRLTATIPP